jgi:hypothetical protein
VESDFDGYFEIEIPKNVEKLDLIINLNQGNPHAYFKSLKINIQNVKLKNTSKIDLGEINLPSFKSIEIDEYEQLNESEKESCFPIKHYANLLGYWYTNKLENKYLILNCENKITVFKYDPEAKTVSVDWNLIKDCE